MSTIDKPCIDDPSYNFFKCTESYYYKVRGCQYPWNVYKDVDVPVCSNYTELRHMLDDSLNIKRRKALFSDIRYMTITKNQCLPPCVYTHYKIRLEIRNWKRPGRSLQIGLMDFTVLNREESLACDAACIIGEIGGNLGLFFGASLFLTLTMVLDYTTNVIDVIYRYQGKKEEILEILKRRILDLIIR